MSGLPSPPFNLQSDSVPVSLPCWPRLHTSKPAGTFAVLGVKMNSNGAIDLPVAEVIFRRDFCCIGSQDE
jgi:hypothetical protein